MCRRTAASALALAITAGAAFGIDVTRPGDFIVASSTNFPAGEPPSAAIDNSGNTKYLNFDRSQHRLHRHPHRRRRGPIPHHHHRQRLPGARPHVLHPRRLRRRRDLHAHRLRRHRRPPPPRYAIVPTPIPGNEATYGMYRVLFPHHPRRRRHEQHAGRRGAAHLVDRHHLPGRHRVDHLRPRLLQQPPPKDRPTSSTTASTPSSTSSPPRTAPPSSPSPPPLGADRPHRPSPTSAPTTTWPSPDAPPRTSPSPAPTTA